MRLASLVTRALSFLLTLWMRFGAIVRDGVWVAAGVTLVFRATFGYAYIEDVQRTAEPA